MARFGSLLTPPVLRSYSRRLTWANNARIPAVLDLLVKKMINVRKLVAPVIAATVMSASVALPVSAPAQTKSQLNHRQKLKNQWRNLGIAGGVVGAYGLLKGDQTLAALGIGGGLYSAYRYEQDRKSQSRMERARAQAFSHTYLNRGGHHYVRKTVWKHGHKYYHFVRVR